MIQKRPLRKIEQSIVTHLAVNGKNYSDTVIAIQKEYDVDLSGRKLEYRLNEIKKVFQANSQLELGYKYAHKNMEHIIDEVKLSCEAKCADAQNKMYTEAFQQGIEYHKLNSKRHWSDRAVRHLCFILSVTCLFLGILLTIMYYEL